MGQLKSEKFNGASVFEEKIKCVVKAAIQSPTPDNCQPYSFRWEEGALKIYHNSNKCSFAPDPNNFFSVFCLGVVAESIDISCTAENLTPEFSYSLYSPDNEPWCTVTFKVKAQPTDPLNTMIYRRCSDRRAFTGGKLEGEDIEIFYQDAKKFKNANIYFIEECPDDLKKYLHEAYGLAFYWRKFRGDLLKFWHTSDKKAQKSRIGLTWRALNLPRAALYLIRFLHYSWWIGNKLLPIIHKNIKEIEYKDGAGLGCITVSARNATDLIEAGQLCMRNWLRMNHLGFGYGPMGIIMHNYLYELQALGPDIPRRFVEITAAGTVVLRKVFKFSDNEIPVWMFRTGFVREELPDNSRTLRINFESLYENSIAS